MNIRFAASILILSIVSGWCTAQDDNTAQPGNNRFESGTNQEAVEARTQRTLANIEKAVAVLIPGGIPDGTPRKEKMAVAIESFAKGQARDAMDVIEKLATEDPDLPPADIIMAGLSFAIGDSNSGLSILENCAVKYPDYPGVYLSFAQVALNTNRVTDASLHADKSARLIESGNLAPNKRDHFLKQYYEIATGIYLRRKQSQQAAAILDQLQALSPDLPFYFQSKAELAFRDGNNDLALEFLKKHAAAIDSKRIAELTLAEWMKNSGKTAEAESFLLQTLRAYPRDPLTQMTAARMFMAKEEFPKALTALKAFEDINEGETNQTLDMKGRIAFAGLSYDVATEHFKKLIARSRNDASAANILALCLVESDDVEQRKQAQQLSERIASRMSGNSLALGSLAYIYLKNGEAEKATRLMQQVAMARQTTPEISFFIANWLVENNQKKQAAEILQKAVDAKGLFLYRSAAINLLNNIKNE